MNKAAYEIVALAKQHDAVVQKLNLRTDPLTLMDAIKGLSTLTVMLAEKIDEVQTMAISHSMR